MDAHIPHLARDVSFTIDQLGTLAHADPNHILTGRLDLEHVGLVGHSFGAVIGAEACRVDARVRAALLEEAFMPADVVRDGLVQPVMFITRPSDSMRLERTAAGGWTESDIDETLGTMRAVYDHLPDDGYFVQIPRSFHLDMTDAPFLSSLVAWPGLTGPLGGDRTHRIINAAFGRVLRSRAPTRARATARRTPRAVPRSPLRIPPLTSTVTEPRPSDRLPNPVLAHPSADGARPCRHPRA